MSITRAFFTSVAVLGGTHTQTIVATSDVGQNNPALHLPSVALVGNEKTDQQAARAAVRETAWDKTVKIASTHVIPISIAGQYMAGPIANNAGKLMHSDKTSLASPPRSFNLFRRRRRSENSSLERRSCHVQLQSRLFG
jgi:hypothetical protein